MARQKIEFDPTANVPAFNEEEARRCFDASDELARIESGQAAAVRAVAVQVGYQLPGDSADPDLIQRDIAANMRRSVEACLEVGRGLVVLKHACGHGNFTARLDVLCIEASVAQRFMQAAAKFSKAASTQLLKAAGNQTKLFEMLVLDDEQIGELELNGQTGELSLDDVATMSVKELRAAVRQERERREDVESLLAGKDRKINELSMADAKARPVTKPWGELLINLRAEIAAHFNLLDESTVRLLSVHDAVLQSDFGDEDDPQAAAKIRRTLAVQFGDRLNRLIQQAAELADRYDTQLAGYASELDGRSLFKDAE